MAEDDKVTENEKEAEAAKKAKAKAPKAAKETKAKAPKAAKKPKAKAPKAAKKPKAKAPKAAKEAKAKAPKAAKKPKAKAPKAAKEEVTEAPEAKAEVEAPAAPPEAAKEEVTEAPEAEAEAEAPAAPPEAEPAPVPPEVDGEGRTITDLADLGTAGDGLAAAEPEQLPEPKIDDHGRSYATGKRKDAVARVWIKPGTGQIIVNTRPLETYFARPVLRMIIGQPFAAAARVDQYDVTCTVKGGGLSGQAGAVRHGISKALTLYEPALRKPLKSGGFLTRDSRVVERKKYGRHKARRSHQFSKR